MNIKFTHIGATLAVIGLLTSATVSATVVTGYTPGAAGTVPAGSEAIQVRTAFLSSLDASTVRNENFESFTPPPSSFPLTLFGGGTSLTPIGSSGRIENVKEQAGFFPGRFNTTSNQPGTWWQTAGEFSLTFAAVSAFGFYATDIGDFRGSLSITVFSGANQLDVETYQGAGDNALNGALLFFGYTNETKFDKLVFKINQDPEADGPDVVGFDDMILGNLPSRPAPEPATLALAALSLGALAATRRRKTLQA